MKQRLEIRARMKKKIDDDFLVNFTLDLVQDKERSVMCVCCVCFAKQGRGRGIRRG